MIAEIKSNATNSRMTVRITGITEINPDYNAHRIASRIRLATSCTIDNVIYLSSIIYIKIYTKNLGGKHITYEHGPFSSDDTKDIEDFYKLVTKYLIIEENL